MLRTLVSFYYLRWLRRRAPEMFDPELAAAAVSACIAQYSSESAAVPDL